MLTCPFLKTACLEENCAIWVPKGDIKTMTIPKDLPMAGAKVYEHEGCCAFKSIARRVG